MTGSSASAAAIRRGILGCVAGLVVSASAWGQAASADGQAAPPPALAGPKIDQPISESTQNFVPTEREREARARLSARMLPTLLREMGSRRAPEGVRLTARQIEQIEALRHAHDEEINGFIQGRKSEIVANLRILGLAAFADRVESLERVSGEQVRGLVDRAPRAAMAQLVGPEKLAQVESGVLDRRTLLFSLTPDQRSALEGLNSLRQGMPGDEGFLASLMGVLDEAQRAFVEQRLTQAFRRMQGDGQGRIGDARPAAPTPDPPTDSQSPRSGGEMGEMSDMQVEGGEPLPRLRARRGPDRLDRLLERLTPEQREALADMIERRMLDGRRGGELVGREKAPPRMSDIDLPPPGR